MSNLEIEKIVSNVPFLKTYLVSGIFWYFWKNELEIKGFHISYKKQESILRHKKMSNNKFFKWNLKILFSYERMKKKYSRKWNYLEYNLLGNKTFFEPNIIKWYCIIYNWWL